MSVSGISNRGIGNVTAPKSPAVKPPPQPAPGYSVSTPAATVEFSAQALAAAASHAGQVSNTVSASNGPAPKVDPAKLAIKESNEPLPLLTKQAKHGDAVAKLILKQVEKKQEASQPQASAGTNASAAAADEGSESEGAGEEHATTSKGSSNAEPEESASATVAESSEGQGAEAHA